MDFSKQTTTIPLFPLPLVVFPSEPLPLHIFEDRFKAMIAYCTESDPPRMFGISLSEKGNLRPIGCAVRIQRIVRQYDDGSMDLITVGVYRYEMVELIGGLPYPRAAVRFFDDTPSEVPRDLKTEAITLHTRLIELVKGKPPLMNFPATAKISFLFAHEAGLDIRERQVMLEMRTETERLAFLTDYYRRTIPDIAEKTEVQDRIRANGYFRRFAGDIV